MVMGLGLFLSSVMFRRDVRRVSRGTASVLNSTSAVIGTTNSILDQARNASLGESTAKIFRDVQGMTEEVELQVDDIMRSAAGMTASVHAILDVAEGLSQTYVGSSPRQATSDVLDEVIGGLRAGRSLVEQAQQADFATDASDLLSKAGNALDSLAQFTAQAQAQDIPKAIHDAIVAAKTTLDELQVLVGKFATHGIPYQSGLTKWP